MTTFLRGFWACSPFLLVIIPFSILFGVLAQEAGLQIWETMGFSLVVFAGAAQFSALQLMQEQAPVMIILATSLAVNLRLGMYSAALTPHFGKLPWRMRLAVAFCLVDQSYAAAAQEFERNPTMPLPDKLAYFFGAAMVVALPWYVATWVGAKIGSAIPPDYALDFAMPITFIAMIAPLLRSIPHLAAAFTSVTVTLALAGMPFSSGLLVAAVVAMVVGALTEQLLERRA